MFEDLNDDEEEFFNKLIKTVLGRACTDIVEHMDPDYLLDTFEEIELFPRPQLRDIRQGGTTSVKNRAIQDKIASDPYKYDGLKRGLAKTDQKSLLEILENLERSVHDSLKEKGEEGLSCSCTSTELCSLLEKLRLSGTDAVGSVLDRDRQRPKQINNPVKGVQRILLDYYDKKCQQVPIYPLNTRFKAKVERIYVTQHMKTVDPRGKRPNHDREPSKVISNIGDIFYTDDRRCKDIYITGEAGYGKSTFCEHLVNLWCRAHKSQEGEANLSEDEKAMLDFQLLFYIHLKKADVRNLHTGGETEIMNLVKQQINPSVFKVEESVVSECLADESTLILMDSLDEFRLEGCPQREFHNNSTVLITSRPWKVEALSEMIGDRIDKQIEIIELEKCSQERLVGTVVGILNEEYGKNLKPEDFFKAMEDQWLGKYLESPVLLTQMLGLWYSEKDFGKSQCTIYCNLFEKQIEHAKKIRGVPEDLEKQDQTVSEQLPPCFTEEQPFCKKYSSLLLKLSKLAFQSLFGKDRDKALQFDHHETDILGLSDAELKQCLYLGLLTQYKIFGEIAENLKYITFVHKTHQEFLAAVYLSSMSQAPKKLLVRQSSTEKYQAFETVARVVTDLDHSLELDKVIMFSAGINPQGAEKLTKFMMEKTSDIRFQEYRASCQVRILAPPHVDLIKSVQSIILGAVEEAERNDQKVNLQLHDIWLCKFPDNNVDNIDRISSCLKSLDTTEIRSVYIYRPDDDMESSFWQLLDKKWPKSLQKVVVKCKLQPKRFLKIIQSNKNTLHSLYISDLKESIDLSPLANKLKDFLAIRKLTAFGFAKVEMTHSQLQIISEYFQKTSHLKEVRLTSVKCATHADQSNCDYTIDLSNHQNLTGFDVCNISASKILFDSNQLLTCEFGSFPNKTLESSVLSRVRNARDLELLSCHGLHDPTPVATLLADGQAFENLKKIYFIKTDLRNVELSLMSFEKLMRVDIQNGLMTTNGLKVMHQSLVTRRVLVLLGNGKEDYFTLLNTPGTENILDEIRNSPPTVMRRDNVDKADFGWKVNMFDYYTNKRKTY